MEAKAPALTGGLSPDLTDPASSGPAAPPRRPSAVSSGQNRLGEAGLGRSEMVSGELILDDAWRQSFVVCLDLVLHLGFSARLPGAARRRPTQNNWQPERRPTPIQRWRPTELGSQYQQTLAVSPVQSPFCYGGLGSRFGLPRTE